MWEALKTCPKSNKSPNLVTLVPSMHEGVKFTFIQHLADSFLGLKKFLDTDVSDFF